MDERPPAGLDNNLKCVDKKLVSETRSVRQFTHLTLNAIAFSVEFPKSELLRFFTTVQTSNNKTRSAYTLVDSGASHGFIDVRYVRILGLVPRICGSMVVSTAGNRSEEMPRRQVYLKAALKGTKGNEVAVD